MFKVKPVIGIIGLGYVGLPLVVEFGKKYDTFGFDVNKRRIEQLKLGNDINRELTSNDVFTSEYTIFTSEITDLKDCNIYIVTVPTPVDKWNNPDLSLIASASRMIASLLDRGNIVVYESTFAPGTTEDFCVPLLENYSSLKHNVDFYTGYSPERVNPGDREHTLPNIKKITAGSTSATADYVDALYSSIITAGTYRASSIKVAEAAKVVENVQRDVNIAFVNELSKIFNLLEIDTHEVLEAARTKWNFLDFKPGLVGGHCIGVDPFYLVNSAVSVGYNPEVILASRRLNDSMPTYIVMQFVKMLILNDIKIRNSSILILGVTFKENCCDIRNSKIIDVIKELSLYGMKIEIYDPLADIEEVSDLYSIKLLESLNFEKKYDGILVAVAHDLFKSWNYWKYALKNKSIIFDLKGILNKDKVHSRL